MRDVTLTPPNRGALWSSLALTKSQLAELCGLTTRQVSHWASQGYIMPARVDPERFNGDAIDLCVLIKQGLSAGMPLRRSVTRARSYIADELARQPGMSAIVPPSLLDIREKLRGAEAAIVTILQAVEPLVPQHAELERLPEANEDTVIDNQPSAR